MRCTAPETLLKTQLPTRIIQDNEWNIVLNLDFSGSISIRLAIADAPPGIAIVRPPFFNVKKLESILNSGPEGDRSLLAAWLHNGDDLCFYCLSIFKMIQFVCVAFFSCEIYRSNYTVGEYVSTLYLLLYLSTRTLLIIG